MDVSKHARCQNSWTELGLRSRSIYDAIVSRLPDSLDLSITVAVADTKSVNCHFYVEAQ